MAVKHVDCGAPGGAVPGHGGPGRPRQIYQGPARLDVPPS